MNMCMGSHVVHLFTHERQQELLRKTETYTLSTKKVYF